ncbi:hypothetical protein [Lachnospira sp.]|uniref:hypothetical protein n=1 Tax=Lachnospira sp. TaxID=2049031 RepID=UPI00257C720D|nr:hypothetical protein [Lachnospira sp.]
MFTNLGMNLVSAAAGLLPGGKVGSIGAKIAKSSKIIINGLMAFGAVGTVEEVKNIINKGNKYGWDTLNTSDWVNLSRAISTAAGIGAGAKRANTYKKVRNNYSITSPTKELLVIEGRFTNP